MCEIQSSSRITPTSGRKNAGCFLCRRLYQYNEGLYALLPFKLPLLGRSLAVRLAPPGGLINRAGGAMFVMGIRAQNGLVGDLEHDFYAFPNSWDDDPI